MEGNRNTSPRRAKNELQEGEGQLNTYLQKDRIKKLRIHAALHDTTVKDLVSNALRSTYGI